MKKRLISIITALVITLGLFASYPVGALTTRDPFQELPFGSYDGYKAEPAPVVWLEHGIYEQSKDYWIVFKNVNFTSSPKSVTLSAYSANTKVTQTGYIELRLDSPDGRLIASIKPNPSTAWGATANTDVDITEEITGIHDLYAVYRETHYQYRIGGIKFNKVGDNLLRVNGKTTGKLYSDSVDKYAYTMANKLVHLGLMETSGENIFGYDTLLTVEEALKAAARMQGKDFLTEVKKDGTSETQYFRQFGYNKKNDFGKYVASDPITTEDFCGLMLGVLGWDEILSAKGTTVMAQASSLKLFSGLANLSAKHFVTKGQAAQIMENALDAKYLMISAVTGDGFEYDVIKDKGIMSEYDNVHRAEGIVQNNYITALSSGASSLRHTEVIINGNVYDMGNTDIMYSVGKRVEYYFRYDDATGTRTILYYEEDAEQSTYITSEQLIKIGMSEAQYEENGRVKKINFNGTVPVIYNGGIARGYTTVAGLIGDLSEFKGSITFVSNDGDNNTDVIIIESYRSVVFKSFNEEGGIIIDVDGRRYDLKNGTSKYMYTAFKEDGSVADMDLLTKGTVVDIATTYNTTGQAYNTIIVCDGSFYGEITHTNGDYISIDGYDYRLSPELINDGLVSNNNVVEVGAAGTFFTDSFGYIRSFESGEKLMAAIVVDYGVSAKDAFSNQFVIKLYTNDGAMITANGAKNICVDGNNFDNPSLLRDHLDQNAVKGSVAIYRLNGKKELNMLDTIAVGDGGARDRIVRIGVNTRTRLYNNILFGSSIKSAAAWVGELVFTAPYSGSGYTDDEAFYGITNALDAGWARYDFYATDGNKAFADAAVLYPVSIASGNTLFLVERKTTVLTPDGDVTAGADGWFVGSKALRGSITFDSITGYGSYFSDEINPGDIIEVGYDSKGMVVNAGTSATVPSGITRSKIFATDKLSNIIGTINGTQSSETVYWYGEIVDISGNYMVMENDAGATMVCNIKSAKAICYNSATNKAKEVDLSDIVLREGNNVGTGTKVFVRLNQFKAGTILFYK